MDKLQEYMISIQKKDYEEFQLKKTVFFDKQKEGLKDLIRSSTQKLINIKKNRSTVQELQQIQINTKYLETALLNTLNIYIELLADKNIFNMLTMDQIQESIQGYKKCLKRTLDTYNRMTSNTKNMSGKKVIRKSSKSTNSKIDMQNTVQLQKWLMNNFHNPYPSPQQRDQLAILAQLNENQVNNWFVNARQRLIKKISKRDPKEYQKPEFRSSNIVSEVSSWDEQYKSKKYD